MGWPGNPVFECFLGEFVIMTKIIPAKATINIEINSFILFKTVGDFQAPNVLQLGEVAEIEAQKYSYAQKFNRRTAFEFSTKPAILPNFCCAFVFFKIAFQMSFR